MTSVANAAQDLTEADVRGKKTLTVSALLTALLLAQPALAQQENSLSFKDSIERAIMSNPELGARFQDFQSALEGQNVGRGALLPRSMPRVGLAKSGVAAPLVLRLPTGPAAATACNCVS